jgi:hypothetical protein
MGERGERRRMGERERDILKSQHLRSPPIFYVSYSPHGVPLYRRMEGVPFIQLAMWD